MLYKISEGFTWLGLRVGGDNPNFPRPSYLIIQATGILTFAWSSDLNLCNVVLVPG